MMDNAYAVAQHVRAMRELGNRWGFFKRTARCDRPVHPSPIAIAALAACVACGGTGRQLEELKGVESTTLASRVQGIVLVDRPVGGIVGIELPSLREIIVRKPDAGSHPVLALAGPDAQGEIVILEEQVEQHSLKRIALDGSTQREIFSRNGSGLWGMAAGKHLALDSATGRVAFVSSVRLVDDWRVGRLELFDAVTGAAIPLQSTVLSDQALSWFPDGIHLAVSDLVPRKVATDLATSLLGGADPYLKPLWRDRAQVPAVFALDTQTGARQLLAPGDQPLVSRDGERVLLRAPTGETILFDTAEHKAKPVTLPGLTDGPYAFVGDSIVLYMGLPTTGARVGYSGNNSPLVGKKPMRTLKIADFRTGEFQTVADWIDPRAKVSFGH